MIKRSAAVVAICAFGAPAIASPYINVENNAGFNGADGLDYVGNVTDVHLGVEGVQGDASWYFQAGPAIIAPDAGDMNVELSGKMGGAVAVSEKFSLYGEVSGMSAEELEYVNMGLKAGLKYKL
jgi:hypothetical protein